MAETPEEALVCPVCAGTEIEAFNPQSLLFPNVSGNTLLPRHVNHLCRQCGVVFMFPRPSPELLRQYYNDAYRKSEFAMDVEGRAIDLPIQFPESGTSFSRFRNFIDCVEALRGSVADAVPRPGDTMIDIGGYQGMFLHAARQAYGVQGIVVDYSDDGVRFARTALGFEDSAVIDDVYGYTPPARARFVSMVHSLEHVDDPVRLLRHIGSTVLREDGFLYVEVPNLYGAPLNDPVHFFTFSAESLTYALNLAGYEVLRLTTAGNPHAPLTLANDELVLVCLARPASPPVAPRPCAVPDVARKVESNYRRLSRAAIVRQARRAGSEFAKLAYYAFGHFILEKTSKDVHGTIKRLKKMTGLRIHS